MDKGILGDVHHIHAQWHRNMINKPSSLWTMKPGGENNIANWRIYRSHVRRPHRELTSHQVDVADWMFGLPPSLSWDSAASTLQGRPRRLRQHPVDLQYPKGQKLTYSSVSTNQLLPFFNASRPEMGEIIMGTDGTVEITVGDRWPPLDRVVVSRTPQDDRGDQQAGDKRNPL